MKKHILFILIFMLVLFSFNAYAFAKTGPAPQGHRAGPIPIRNQMPLYLFYLQMEPDKANVVEQNKFDINADYTVSSITVSCFTPASSLYNINIDAEISRITLDLRYGLYENLEIGMEIPYISLSRGYMDEFVEDFEDTIGARTPRSRERQGSYNLNYSFIYNNQNLIQKTHSSNGLGDVVLKAKYQLLKEDDVTFWPNLSLRAAFKFPTGEKNDLLGSGEIDYGFGLLLDRSFLRRLSLYSGVNIIFIERPSFFSVLNLKKEIVSGMMGLEYAFTDSLSLVVQVAGNSTPYPTSETNALDNSAFEFGLGLNYTWKEKRNVSWRFGFTENIRSASTPDVSFNTGLRVGF